MDNNKFNQIINDLRKQNKNKALVVNNFKMGANGAATRQIRDSHPPIILIEEEYMELWNPANKDTK